MAISQRLDKKVAELESRLNLMSITQNTIPSSIQDSLDFLGMSPQYNLSGLTDREKAELGMLVCLDKYLELVYVGMWVGLIGTNFSRLGEIGSSLIVIQNRIDKAMILVDKIHYRLSRVWNRKV